MLAVPRVNSRDLACVMKDDADNEAYEQSLGRGIDRRDALRNGQGHGSHRADGQGLDKDVGVHFFSILPRKNIE